MFVRFLNRETQIINMNNKYNKANASGKKIAVKNENPSEEKQTGNLKSSKRGNDNVIKQQNASNKAPCNKGSSNEQHSRSIFVMRLPLVVKEIHLQRFFTRYGKIEEIILHPSKIETNKKTAFAKILFKSEKSAQKSLAVNGMVYKGNFIVVRMRNHSISDEYCTRAVVVTWKIGVDFDSFLHTLQSFGVVKYFYITRDKKCVFIYFQSAQSVELAVAAGTIDVGSYRLSIHRFVENGAKQSEKYKNPHVCRSVRRKRLAKQRKQLRETLESSVQIQENEFDDLMNISFKKGGRQGSKLQKKKEHTLKMASLRKGNNPAFIMFRSMLS